MSIDMNYIDVAERIAKVRGDAERQYPEGTFQPWDKDHPYRIERIGDQDFIVVVAAFYRTPDDPCPGIGMAYEQVPGKTQFTRGSELQNAETSAWGRALVAALAADTKRGIASAQEMRGRSAEPVDHQVRAARIELSATIKAIGVTPDEARKRFSADGHGDLSTSTDVDAIRGLTAYYRSRQEGTA
ncbi:hypothetical protein [Nocardia farcinica]|uniref:hypothetical protein n=1 Tax=Nocardia farcinica TaxID=37329 RepID=UPI00245549CD|nr:hypothetical protein [Nocardia farcinica]